MDSTDDGNKIYVPEKKFLTDLYFWKVTLFLEMKLTLENKLEGDHFTLTLVECCTRFPLCSTQCWQALRCNHCLPSSPPCDKAWGVLGPCNAHSLSSVPPPPHPRLGLVAQLSFISFCVLFLSLARPLALAIVVTECSICPAILHQCHPLRQSLARQQIQH